MAAKCQWCEKALPAGSKAKYCGGTCRGRAHRQRARDRRAGRAPKPDKKAAPPEPVIYDTLAEQVEKSLTEMLALDTISGMAALRIAQQIDRGGDSGAAVATLSKELSRLVAEAKIEAMPRHRDGVDDLADGVHLKLVG